MYVRIVGICATRVAFFRRLGWKSDLPTVALNAAQQMGQKKLLVAFYMMRVEAGWRPIGVLLKDFILKEKNLPTMVSFPRGLQMRVRDLIGLWFFAGRRRLFFFSYGWFACLADDIVCENNKGDKKDNAGQKGETGCIAQFVFEVVEYFGVFFCGYVFDVWPPCVGRRKVGTVR